MKLLVTAHESGHARPTSLRSVILACPPGAGHVLLRVEPHRIVVDLASAQIEAGKREPIVLEPGEAVTFEASAD